MGGSDDARWSPDHQWLQSGSFVNGLVGVDGICSGVAPGSGVCGVVVDVISTVACDCGGWLV